MGDHHAQTGYEEIIIEKLGARTTAELREKVLATGVLKSAQMIEPNKKKHGKVYTALNSLSDLISG